MSVGDNKRLYDIFTRKQLYIERVKIQQAREFNTVLVALSEELRKILGRITYAKLDGMTKAELNKLLATIRESQFRIYSAYSEKLLNQLKDFMSADLEVSRRTLAPVMLAIESEQDETPMSDDEAIAYIRDHVDSHQLSPLYPIAALTGDDDRMWSSVKTAPMPANGLYLLPFIKNFTASASASVENAVRKGYANGQTVDEVVAEIVGDPTIRQGSNGVLNRARAQASAVTSTATQHVSSMVSAGIASSMIAGYLWVSIIDSSTTEICQERNNKVFQYGNGPLPPAHIRCRSHTSPLVAGDVYAAKNFSDWASEQSTDFLEDFFDEDDSDDIQSGIVSSSTLTASVSDSSLTLSQYRNKVNKILSR